MPDNPVRHYVSTGELNVYLTSNSCSVRYRHRCSNLDFFSENRSCRGGAGAHDYWRPECTGGFDLSLGKGQRQQAERSLWTFCCTLEADLAVQQIPELLSVEGVEIAGPLPGDLQTITVFAVSVPMNAKDSATALRFVAYLRSSEALAVFKAKGLDTQ